MSKPQILGRIYLPRTEGAPVGEFRFIVDPQATDVEIGVPVAADTAEGVLVGTVIDMRTYGEDREPLGSSLAPSGRSVRIDEAMIATVQVFWSPRMRSPRAGVVRAATPEELRLATGYDRMDYRVPAGVIEAVGGGKVPIYFDGRALVGPESAHLMVGGLSGQAAKTSYMGVVLKAALSGDLSATGESVAALIFNVKGEDMLWLDKAPEAGYELTDEDYAIYDALGVPAEPFDDVTVYTPPLPQTRTPGSVRQDADLLCWDLNDIWPYLHYFFGNLYEDEKAQSFLSEYRAIYMDSPNPAHAQYRTFAGLERFFAENLEQKEEAGEDPGWRSHHPATLRRLRRMLGALPARCRGLLTMETSRPEDDIPTDAWTHGQVVVVDIAGLRPEVQSLVVARTCERMLREAEEGDLGVDHLIVLTDELNAFAPQGPTPTPSVRKVIQRISTQGRYAGISLFGAAQKLSKIDELTRDNAATRALGVTADAELASGVYGRMPSGLVERIATLERGYMALTHYSFRAPLIVRFPRPAWRTGRAKGNKKKSKPQVADALGLGPRQYARLTEGVPPEVAEQIISSAKDLEDARRRLEAARRPDMSKAALHEPTQVDAADPFGLAAEDETGASDFGPYALD